MLRSVPANPPTLIIPWTTTFFLIQVAQDGTLDAVLDDLRKNPFLKPAKKRPTVNKKPVIPSTSTTEVMVMFPSWHSHLPGAPILRASTALPPVSPTIAPTLPRIFPWSHHARCHTRRRPFLPTAIRRTALIYKTGWPQSIAPSMHHTLKAPPHLMVHHFRRWGNHFSKWFWFLPRDLR